MSPQNAELAADAFRSALAGRRVTLEDIRSPIDGSLWRSTHVPVRDEHGAIVAAMAVARDVTEKSDAMAAARTGERRLNAALSSMLDPFVLLAAVRDEEGRIVDFVYEYANPAAGVANKVPAEELIGRRLLEFLPGHGETGMFERYAQLVETGEPLVYDGMEYEDVWGGVRERRVFDVRAVPIGEGLAYTWRDVTRRTALEEELERAREEMARAYARLAAIVDAAPIAIAAVDAEDRVTLWSGGSERVFGRSKDEVLGRPLPTVPDEGRDEFEATRARQKAGEALVGVEFTRRHKDGHAIPVAFYSAPVRDGEGRLLETVGILVDVTEQKNAERRLLEALERARRSSESKQALMRALAHDVGNPLTVIRGFAHMLEERSDRLDADQRRLLLSRIRAQADWLLRLTSDLLEAERLDDTEVTRVPTDLSQIVRETLAAVDHREHQVTADAPSMEALVDPVRVRRILENLLVNAFRHTPPGTPVWVRLEWRGSDVVLSVEDAGPGVPEDRRQSLFEPFHRGVASRGTGLGLSLVRRFAVEHGGRAWMEDRPGGGASFKVLLPAV
jgi:hypothetical protein